MAHVHGFVVPIPTARKEEYRAYAEKSAILFKRHGAERLVECWGDQVPDGKLTSFPMAVQCRPDETVVFSWVWWPSKAVMETGMKMVMADHESQGMTPETMPFDGRRMIYGGFDVIVGA